MLVMYLQRVRVINQKKLFFVGILKVTQEKSRIRLRIRTKMSRIQTTTLLLRIRIDFFKNLDLVPILPQCAYGSTWGRAVTLYLNFYI